VETEVAVAVFQTLSAATSASHRSVSAAA
jgi:hypothetical protein